MGVKPSDHEKMFKTQEEIEEIYSKNGSWVEAVIEFCHLYDLGEDEVVPFLSPNLLSKIRDEAVQNKTIKVESTLPF